ncbi:hypothetical protein MTR_4g132790 [Medicago truncatula]|uniref:Uncharacterized protein n=1 Tax=Medicago truncatula TaxID=3880 RepID=G7JKG0_MEDTR|nr:hypothetical protein MTR_4g132790 [Medicago truncatula]
MMKRPLICLHAGGVVEEEEEAVKRRRGTMEEEVKEVPIVVLLGICERNGGET